MIDYTDIVRVTIEYDGRVYQAAYSDSATAVAFGKAMEGWWDRVITSYPDPLPIPQLDIVYPVW